MGSNGTTVFVRIHSIASIEKHKIKKKQTFMRFAGITFYVV